MSGDLDDQADHLGNRQRIGAWADFVYLRRGRVTHVRPFHYSMYGQRADALCGREPDLFGGDWLGTGNQTEIDQARRMPLCIRCMNLSEGRAA